MALSGPDRWISSSAGRRIVVLLPLVVAVDLLVVLALGLLPVGSIADLRCDAVLRGGKPAADLTLAAPIRARQAPLCADARRGRILVMIGVGIAIFLVSAGAVLAPADRLERALVRREEDEEAERREAEQRRLDAERESDAREAGRRDEQAMAERAVAAREQAAADRRAANVARARARRLEARSEPGAAPGRKAKPARKLSGDQAARKVTKKVTTKATKATAVTTASKATKKASTKVITKAPSRVTSKAPSRVTSKAPTKVTTKASDAGGSPAAKKIVSRRGPVVSTRQPRKRAAGGEPTGPDASAAPTAELPVVEV